MKKLLSLILILTLILIPLTACSKDKPEDDDTAEQTDEVVQTGDTDASDAPEDTDTPEPEIPDSADDYAYVDLIDAQSVGILTAAYTGAVADITAAEASELVAAAYDCATAIGLSVSNQVIAPDAAPTRAQFAELTYNLLASLELPESAKPSGHIESFLRERGVLYDDGTADMGGSCTVDEAILMLTRAVIYAADAADVMSQGLLWEVSDEDTTVYLLGTIHVDDDTLYPFSTKLVEALISSDAVVMEIDLGDADGVAYMQQISQYSNGDGLSQHVSEETISDLLEIYLPYGITDASQLESFKPWALASEISNLALYEDTQGAAPLVIDMYVYSKAILSGVEIRQIESYEYQADMLDRMSDELQEEYLKQSIDQYNGVEYDGATYEDMIALLLSAWRARDIDAFNTAYDKDLYEDEFSTLLFADRDDTMSDYVLTLLEENAGQFFVAVGAGHMVGSGGIVAQLTNAGYEVSLSAA